MRKLLSIAAALVLVSSVQAQDKDWKKNLERALNTEFPPRQMQSGLRGTTVKDPGITLAIQQTGVRANCQVSLMLPGTRVKNGNIINAPSGVKSGQAVLRPGTQAYVHDISVDDNDIRFRLETIELFAADGLQWADATGDKRNKAQKCQMAIHFEFEKDFLKTADVAAVKKEINSVLASAEQAAAANQKTIELGQTMEEVEKMFGKPTTVAKLGAKTIYAYKDMKVIFTDGKVTC